MLGSKTVKKIQSWKEYVVISQVKCRYKLHIRKAKKAEVWTKEL